MKLQYLALTALSVIASAGCKDKGEAFLALPQLCSARAHDICAARALCCNDGDTADGSACEAEQRAQCQQQRDLFTADDGLVYDSVFAQRQHGTQAAALEQCEPPLSVGEFFQGTLVVGALCDSDSQCRAGRCDADGDSGRCADPVLELCPAAE